MIHLFSFIIILLCCAWTSLTQALSFPEDPLKLSAFSSRTFVAEFVAETVTPTNDIAHKKYRYSKERVHVTKEVSKIVAGLVAVAAGMDPADVSIAVLEATTSVENNFAHSLKKRNGGLETSAKEDDDDDGYSSDESVDDIDYDTAKTTKEPEHVKASAQAKPTPMMSTKAGTAPRATDEIELAAIERETSFLRHLEAETGNFDVGVSGRYSPTGRTAAAEKAAADCRRELLNADERTRFNYKQHDINPENRARSAYKAQETLIGQNAIWKGLTGQTLTDAEKQVRNDYLKHQAAELALDVAFAKAGDLYHGVKGLFVRKTAQSTIVHTKSAAGILEKGSGLKPKIPVNSNNPLPANLNRMSVPQTLAGVSEVNGIHQLAQKIAGKPGAGLKTNQTPTMSNAPRPVVPSLSSNTTKPSIPATNTGTINGQNQTRKLLEATIGVNAKPVGGAIPNKPVMLLETAEKASVAAKKVRDAQAAAKDVASNSTHQATRNPVWEKGPVVRGNIIEKEVGQNLPQTFPTLDRMAKGNATSIKSRDLDAKTYLNPTKLRHQLKKDIDKLADFKRGQVGEIEVKLADIKQKILDVHVPHEGHSMQRVVFDAMQEYAAAKNIILNVKVY